MVFTFQPAAEIIGFRLGELRGLSKWRLRYQGVGLDEKLIDNATEKAGMLLIQIERFMRVLSSSVQQVLLLYIYVFSIPKNFLFCLIECQFGVKHHNLHEINGSNDMYPAVFKLL